MSLEEICLSFRHQFHQLGAYLSEEYQIPAGRIDPADLEFRHQWLVEEIRRRTRSIARSHAELVELRRRLTRHEKECSDLLKRAKIFYRLGDQTNAWNSSLDLEQLRQLISHERSRLKSHEKVYWNQVAHIRRLEQRLARISEQLARKG